MAGNQDICQPHTPIVDVFNLARPPLPQGSFCTYAIIDTFAELMNEVCHDVEVEHHQSLQGESFDHRTTTVKDEHRLDKGIGTLGDAF